MIPKGTLVIQLEFITVRVYHPIGFYTFIWAVGRRKSAMNMLSCVNAVERQAFAIMFTWPIYTCTLHEPAKHEHCSQTLALVYVIGMDILLGRA